MYGFSSDLAISLLRHILTFIGGIIVAKGWISAELSSQLVGAVVAAVGALYAAHFHATSNGSIPTLSASPNAQTIVSNADNIIQQS